MKILSYIIIALLYPVIAEGSTVWFTPRTHDPVINEKWIVDVMIESHEALNAIEGEILFPSDLLHVESLSSAESALAMWIRPPTVEQSLISFSGIAPGGFKNVPRRIFSITFIPQGTGTRTLTFKKILALVHNGNGSTASLSQKSLPFTIADTPRRTADAAHDMPSDAIPPEHFIPEIGKDAALFGGKWFIAWIAHDKQSGVIRYELCETMYASCTQGAEWLPVTSPYPLRDQTLRSFVHLRAIDAFGNIRTERIRPYQPRRWYMNGTLWCILILLPVCAYYRFKK